MGEVMWTLADRVGIGLAAELWAIWCRLEFCLDIGFYNAILESNCLPVVQMVNSESASLSTEGHIVNAILMLIMQVRSFSCFMFLGRLTLLLISQLSLELYVQNL